MVMAAIHEAAHRLAAEGDPVKLKRAEKLASLNLTAVLDYELIRWLLSLPSYETNFIRQIQDFLRANPKRGPKIGRDDWGAMVRRVQAWESELAKSRLAGYDATPWPAEKDNRRFAALSVIPPVWTDETTGLRVVRLCSDRQLTEETTRLRHCVSTYAYRAKTWQCAIASVRDSEGNSLATIEISFGREEMDSKLQRKLLVVQCRGRFNAVPATDSDVWATVKNFGAQFEIDVSERCR
jgi:hypothetical protein